MSTHRCASPPIWGGNRVFPPHSQKSTGGNLGISPPHFQNGWGGNWVISHQAMGGENFWPPDVMGGDNIFGFPPHRMEGKAQIVSKTARIVAKNQILGRFWAVYGGGQLFHGGGQKLSPPRFEHRGGGIFVPPHGSDTLGGEFFWCPPPPWGGNAHPCLAFRD